MTTQNDLPTEDANPIININTVDPQIEEFENEHEWVPQGLTIAPPQDWIGNLWPLNPVPGNISLLLFGKTSYGFFLSVDHQSHTKAFLIAVPDDSIQIPHQLPQFRGFTLSVVSEQIPQPFSCNRSLKLSLNDSEFEDIFNALVSDVASYAGIQTNLQAVVMEAVHRVNRWKQLLENLPTDGLNATGQTGLYGELWFVKHFASVAWGIGPAIQAWCGPLNTNQDVQRGLCAVEVKSTTRVDPVDISIANTRQLDNGPFEDLTLYHIVYERVQGGTDTLPALIADLREQAQAGGVGAVLEEKLLLGGYSDFHREKYLNSGYVVRKQTGFQVGDSFPRITETDVRAGVQNVRYNISVDACQASIIKDEDLKSLLSGYS